MAGKKEKTVFLLLGLFLGLLIGVSIMVWQKKIFSSDLISFKTLRGLVQKIYETPDDVLSQIKTKFSKDKSKLPVTKKTSTRDTSKFAGNDSLSGIDSLEQLSNIQGSGMDYYIEGDPINDSLMYAGGFKAIAKHHDTSYADTSHYRRPASVRSADVVVKRDELLQYKMVRVTGFHDSTGNRSAYLDSLLTNDKFSRRTISGQYRIEFWRSPINYFGYRMSKDKIILYGISDVNNVALEFTNKSLYLKHLNNYYLLENTENFKPLIVAKKPEILTKSKK